MRIIAFIIACLICFPVYAFESRENKISLYNYSGNIGGDHKIRMSLIYHGKKNKVTGVYIFVAESKERALLGKVTEENQIQLEEYDNNGNISHVFEGNFRDLNKEELVGIWKRKSAYGGLPFKLKAYEISELPINRDEPENYDAALEWYKKAAEQGHADAQYYLGVLYENGKSVQQSYEDSVRWYRKAADRGYAEAQCNLGGMYANGNGVAQDDAEAMKWFMKAARQGQPLAQYRVGFMYAAGRSVPQNDIEAVKWYRKAAEQRQVYAQFSMGEMYENGQGVLQQDYSEAMKWYKMAAEQDLVFAKYRIGLMYGFGRGVEQNHSEAMTWFMKAAGQGHAEAQYNIGTIYENGLGVPKNYWEAIKWYQKAAEQGNTDAKNRINYIYKNEYDLDREHLRPHIISTENRSLSNFLLKEYTERFLSKRLNSNFSDAKKTESSLNFYNYINHDDFEWCKWEKSLDLEFRNGSLFESNLKIGNNYLFIHIWDDGFNPAWDSYFYYLVPLEQRKKFLKDFEKDNNKNNSFYSAHLYWNYYESPFPDEGAYPINNIFRYKGCFYIIDDFLTFRDNDGVRNLLEIKKNGDTVNVATFKIFPSIKELDFSNKFSAYMSFLKTVNNIYGPGSLRYDGALNIHKRDRNIGNYSAERAIARPWIASAEYNEYYVYNDRLVSFLVDWSLTDIWNSREYQTLLNHIPAAEYELFKFYQDKLGISEKNAQKLSEENIKHVIAAFFQVPRSFPDYQSEKNLKLRKEIIKGQYSDSFSKDIFYSDSVMKEEFQTFFYYDRDFIEILSNLSIDNVSYIDKILSNYKYDSLKNKFSKTMLMYAAHINNFDTVKYLIESGFDVNEITKLNDRYEDSYGIELPRNLNRSALTYAAENGSIELIALLLDNGAKEEITGGSLKFYLLKNPRFTEEEKKLPINELVKKFKYSNFFKPSFECYNASTKIEKAICKSKTLSIYDRELGNAYRRLMAKTTYPEFEKKDQKSWLRKRNNQCGDLKGQELSTCIGQFTRSRTRYIHNRIEQQ